MYTGKLGILKSNFIIYWMFSVVIKICFCQSNNGETEVVSQNTNNLAPPSDNNYGVQHPTISYYYPDYYGYYDQTNYQTWLNYYLYWLLMRRQFEEANQYNLEYSQSIIKKSLDAQKEKTEYDQLLDETLKKYRNILKNYSSHIKELNKLISKPKEEAVKDSSVDSIIYLEKDSSVEKKDRPDYSSEYDETVPHSSETTEYFTESTFEDVSENTELKKFDESTEEFLFTTNEDEILDKEKYCVNKKCAKPTDPIGGFKNNNTLDVNNASSSQESTEIYEDNISFSATTILYDDRYLEKNKDTTEQNTKDSMPTEEKHTNIEYSTVSCHAKESSNENCRLQEATEDSLPAEKYFKYLHTTLGNIETTTKCHGEVMATTDLDTNVLQCKDCAEVNEVRDAMKRIRLAGLLFLDMGHLLLNEDCRFPIVPKVVEHAKKHG